VKQEQKRQRERGQSQVKVGRRHIRYVVDTTSDNVSTTQPGGRVKLHERHPKADLRYRMFCVRGLTDAYFFSRHSYSAGRRELRPMVTGCSLRSVIVTCRRPGRKEITSQVTRPAANPGEPMLCAMRCTASCRASLPEGRRLVPVPASQGGRGVHPGGDAVAAPRHCRCDLSPLLVGLPLLVGRHLPRCQVAQHLIWQEHDLLPVIFRNIRATIFSVHSRQPDVKRV
jgi:hypothetical protein